MENMTFEQKIGRLEEIVALLEKGDAQLADSLQLFEEGTKLAGDCAKLLDDAELQVKQITVAEDGRPVEETFYEQ